MKSILKVTTFCFTLLIFVIMQAAAFQNGEIKKTFKDVKSIRIKTVSGDCVVNNSNNDAVEVILKYTYDDEDFEPEFDQSGDRLILTERFRGHSMRGIRGRSTWYLNVPQATDIDFSTASGDFAVSDLKSTIEASTASGDVELTNITGEFDVSTASGDIKGRDVNGNVDFNTASGDVDLAQVEGELSVSTASGEISAENLSGEIDFSTASGKVEVSQSTGEFELSAASGRVEADEITLTARSSFSTASGDVEVVLAKNPEYNLKISSASGDALLNFNNHPIEGFIRMTAKADRGRIKAPFKFDDEEIYYKWDDEYVTKSVTRGSNKPRIEISTASGSAVLREK